MSYRHDCAIFIQKRWRGMHCRRTELPSAKRAVNSRKLLTATLQGFKIRKIWACKEVVTLITTIKDLQEMKLQWTQEQKEEEPHSQLEIKQISLDRRRRVEKLISTILRLYKSGDWVQMSAKAKKRESRFIPDYRPSLLEEQTVQPFSFCQSFVESNQSETLSRKRFNKSAAASLLEVPKYSESRRKMWTPNVGESKILIPNDRPQGTAMLTNSQSDLSRGGTYEEGPIS